MSKNKSSKKHTEPKKKSNKPYVYALFPLLFASAAVAALGFYIKAAPEYNAIATYLYAKILTWIPFPFFKDTESDDIWKDIPTEDRGEFVSAKKNYKDGKWWNLDCEVLNKEKDVIFEGCTPNRCGRYVKDEFITEHEVDSLIAIAEKAMHYSEGNGAIIFDLASGAVTYKSKFINVYQMINALHEADEGRPKALLNSSEAKVLSSVYSNIEHLIKDKFKIKGNVHLSAPSFFSRIEGFKADKTLHPNDEYYHPHVDKEQYRSFAYTALVYLSTHTTDFTGGQFVFLDRPSPAHTSDVLVPEDPEEVVELKQKTRRHIVQPKRGRLQMFTSGHENLHVVEKVLTGRRYAFTVAFTCDEKMKVTDILKKGLQGIDSSV